MSKGKLLSAQTIDDTFRHLYGRELVYYLDLGDCCKIGHSRNIMGRLQSHYKTWPHAVLAAVEDGDLGVEADRHQTFAALRITEGPNPAGYMLSTEKFTWSDELREWVATVAGG